MCPRFVSEADALDFASYSQDHFGVNPRILRVGGAFEVRPQNEVPCFWRIANAWGYLFAKEYNNGQHGRG